MAESKGTKTSGAKKTPSANQSEAKEKFSKAIEEAKAGAAALKADAVDRAGTYKESASAKAGDLVEEAKVYGEKAKVKAGEIAVEGKTRASETIAKLGTLVSDNAGTIDEKFGEKYGDYARTASQKMQSAAEKIEAKDLAELPEDARQFVRKSPGLAIGMAAVAGFMLARLFSRK
jgi:ElaB/YqjD/DUF883 family membrane-anchored ribosome-binding protein